MMFNLQKLVFSKRFRGGYIALLSVIAVSTIGIAIMLSIVMSGINVSRTDFSVQQGGGARVLASSCGEEALQKILETGTTSSSASISIGGETCTYTITSQNGQNITINGVGILGTVKSKVIIVVATTTPSLILSSWQEVGDF